MLPLLQEEPEEFIACLWYKAACSASDPHQQLKAYQTAIDTLQVLSVSLPWDRF